MNPHLAAMYNTNGYGEAVQAEQTKIAHVDLFCKAAAAEGIDLSTMTEDVRAQLFENFCEKLASDDKDADDKGGDKDKAPPFMKKEEKGEKKEEDEKEAAARAEFLAQAEWQQKTAEADFLGRQMAHAFMAEKSEIEKEAKEKPEFQKKHSPTLLGAGRGAPGGTATQTDKGAKLTLGTKARDAAREVGKRVGESAKRVGDFAGKHKGKAALVGGGVAAGAVGAALASRSKKDSDEKSASAFDVTAAEQGVKIAMEYGYDGDQAVERLNAVLTLGPAESEKIAHANGDYDTALNLRGLELLESAGYPIAWDDILG
jgi:hypothetical protein